MSKVTLDGAAGFLLRAEKPRAGALLLPTIFGVNKFVRDYASVLAGAGLTTLIWDPYSHDPLPANFDEAKARASQLHDGPSLDSASICVDYLMGELRLDRIGTLGFCLGGRYTLLLAARDTRLGACASIYPTIESPRSPNQEDDVVSVAGSIPCPVQLVYPGGDHLTTAETFQRLQSNLQRREAATVVQLHPKAGHGFWHNAEPANEAAARWSKPIVTAFLEACLSA